MEGLKYSQPETLTFYYTEYQNEIKATYTVCTNNTAKKLAISVQFYTVLFPRQMTKGQNFVVCISLLFHLSKMPIAIQYLLNTRFRIGNE